MKRIFLLLISLTITISPKILAETNPLRDIFEGFRIGKTSFHDVKTAVEILKAGGERIDIAPGFAYDTKSGRVTTSFRWWRFDSRSVNGVYYEPTAVLEIEFSKRFEKNSAEVVWQDFLKSIDHSKIRSAHYTYYYLESKRKLKKD